MPKYYEPDNFEDSYRTFLEKALSNNLKNNGSDYIDPDGGSVPDFYDDLACFLNGRENDCIEEKERYSFSSPLLSGYSKISVVRNNEKLFGLTSDQFGFRADEAIYEENKRHKYPLSRLLYSYKEKSKIEQNKIIVQIIEYVKNTRTIGGSFLWPMPLEGRQDCTYNRIRGVAHYLEDRVDLTLLEIKHALDALVEEREYKSDSDILYKQYINEKTNMKEWLDHFGSFKIFVEYFMLKPFCEKVLVNNSQEDYDYMPISIIDGKPIEEEEIKKYKNEKNSETWDIRNMEEKRLLNMLDRLEGMILIRTANMERAIELYRKEQEIHIQNNK